VDRFEIDWHYPFQAKNISSGKAIVAIKEPSLRSLINGITESIVIVYFKHVRALLIFPCDRMARYSKHSGVDASLIMAMEHGYLRKCFTPWRGLNDPSRNTAVRELVVGETDQTH
jgi:hypothetical protein